VWVFRAEMQRGDVPRWWAVFGNEQDLGQRLLECVRLHRIWCEADIQRGPYLLSSSPDWSSCMRRSKPTCASRLTFQSISRESRRIRYPFVSTRESGKLYFIANDRELRGRAGSVKPSRMNLKCLHTACRLCETCSSIST
jgi:hypothetical protein